MFIKAKIDPMFDGVRPQVDALLEEILQKTKANAEKEISNVEFAFQKMKKWFNEDYALSDDMPRYKLIRNKISGAYASGNDMQKYNFVSNKISDAKSKLKTQSYFGCDDALGIMSEAKRIVDEIQASIRSDLDSTKRGLEGGNTELKGIPDKLNKVDTEKQRTVVITFLLFIVSIVLYKIAWWGVNLCPYEAAAVGGILWHIGTVIVVIISAILLLGSGLAAIIIFVILLGSFANLFISGEPTKKLKTRRKELKEQISMLERRIAAAKESLL
jgi:hypothetical protein